MGHNRSFITILSQLYRVMAINEIHCFYGQGLSVTAIINLMKKIRLGVATKIFGKSEVAPTLVRSRRILTLHQYFD